MKKLLSCTAMLLALHCGFAHAQPAPPVPSLTGQKLMPDDSAVGNGFGGYVSVDGNIAVIGANGSDTERGVDSGAAYAFVRGEDGKWTQEAKLIPNDGGPSYLFGSVSLSGDTALIGAAWDDSQGEKSGAAYIFVRAANGTWTQQAKLLPNDGTGWDVFGDRVALEGDTAVIGAWADDDKGDASGSAYVFVRAANGTWSQKQKLLPNDGSASAHFGYPVVLRNGIMMIGAERDKGDKGSAYVFAQDGNGTWTQQAKLVASDGVAGDIFGHTIAMSGNTALIGSIFDDDKGADSGSVYVFERAADGTWSEKQKLTADDGAAGDHLSAVSLDGDRALIGAGGKNSSIGSAYIFARGADGSWSQKTTLTVDEGTANDEFGVSAALQGDTALVGARGIPGGTKHGYAYIYDLASTFPVQYTVTPSANNGGSISPDTPQSVDQDATISFTVLADAGYRVETVEGCGGTLSGSTYTTGAITEDCAVTASFTPYATRNGMTWGTAGYNSTLDISKVHCCGEPKPEGATCCNAYQGETSCSKSLPVLCVKVDGTPRPPYPVSMKQWDTEYYNGWAEGSIALTAPAQGNAFASLADVNAYCEAQLGAGYQVAEHHTGRWVCGMNENNFYGDTWPSTTNAGGWGFYGPGQLTSATRFWVDINDQDANCWDRELGHTLSVNSSGAEGVAITGSPSTYSGATNYTKINIPDGASITLTAPAEGSTSTTFSSWSGCDETDATARTCTITMSADKTVTAVFLPNSFTVTPSAGANGSINPDTPQTVPQGEKTSFAVTPDIGYKIDKVEGCGGTLSGTTYTTGEITEDCTVTASFKLSHTWRVFPWAGHGGRISPSRTQRVEDGETTSFTITPKSGYGIRSVSGCGGSLSGTTYTTGPITQSCVVRAWFKKLPKHFVIPFADRHGSISPHRPQKVLHGETTSFSVTPKSGYVIKSVSGCGGSLDGNTYTTGPVTHTCMVRASFSRN